LKSNEILGPRNRVNPKKYKYEVLTGTLFIKGVSLSERGLYTCYCKELNDTSFKAKSVMLVVRPDWQQIWEADSVNLFRVGAMLVVAGIIALIVYIIYNNIKREQLMQFKDFTNENVLDEVSSRKASYSLPFPKHERNIEMRGIDNPVLDVKESSPAYFNNFKS